MPFLRTWEVPRIFFSQFKKPKSFKPIESIINEHGDVRVSIDGIKSVVYNYYKNLFSADRSVENSDRLTNMFLNVVEGIPFTTADIRELLKPISEEELWECIEKLKMGKSPGMDGLSAEFYKVVFSIIKNDLLAVLNGFMEREFIPSKVKRGIIHLCPKKEPYDDIKNYRPITLLNLDYKIYTKILNERIKPWLPLSIHESQYAVPGKPIFELNQTLRDLFEEMKECDNNLQDSFFISFDFAKAYDSINQTFLFKVLEKMNFPEKFIGLIKSIYNNASSNVFVNGSKTKPVKLESGTRQGDPFSQSLYIIAQNPLLIFLNQHESVFKYKSVNQKEFLTLALSDDMTAVTNSITTVLNIMNFMGQFGQVAGLKINRGKTKGFFFNRTGLHRMESLPAIKWNEETEILGVPYGINDAECREKKWDEIWKGIQSDVQYYNNFHLTLDAKAVISKSKLLPKVSYFSSTVPIPERVQSKLNNIMLEFVVPHKKTFLCMDDFAMKRHLGGYNIDHVVTHAKLFILKPIFEYIRNKENGIPLSNNQYFIEYNLGQQLSSFYRLPRDNHTPHRFRPNRTYQYILNLLKMAKFPKQDLMEGKIKQLYESIVNSKYHVYSDSFRYSWMHSNFLPNYLKTFNFQVHYGLLPLKSKFVNFALDNDSRCCFCGLNYETPHHVFSGCNKLHQFWLFLDETVTILLDYNYDFLTKREVLHDYDIVHTRCHSDHLKIIIYLNSIANFVIWKYRNEIYYDQKVFAVTELVDKFIGSIRARCNINSSINENKRIPQAQALFQTLCLVKNSMFHFDRG